MSYEEVKVSEHLLLGIGDSEELRAKRVSTIKGNIAGLAVVYDYLKHQLDLLEKSELSDKAFDNPNWPYKQARLLGEKKTLTNLLNVLKFSKDFHDRG
jgi:hypothetical protein